MATSRYDVAVIGAGPGGLAGAAAAVRAGASVALIDSASQPGGQYWRHPSGDYAAVADLHQGTAAYRSLVRRAAPAAWFLQHQVWTIEREKNSFVVRAMADGVEVEIAAAALVLAPGAFDRQVPFPGWDLPGVYTAGGAQALLKGHQVLAGRRIAVGGTGPFLLPVAAGLSARGAEVVGVFEANSPRRWVRQARSVLPVVGKLAEGAGYAATLLRHRVPYRVRHAVVAAHGTDSLAAVTVARLDAHWRVIAGSERVIDCDAIAVGWGFTPQLELPLALGCETRADVDGSLVVCVDDLQQSSVESVYVAGEACGVGGAQLAVLEGSIAGRAAAGDAARAISSRQRRRRRALRAFAAVMHEVHSLRDGWQSWLSDDTVVCRCEEVPAREIRAAVGELGALDARSAKRFTRAGMGWCQGRVCGHSTGRIAATAAGRSFDPLGLAGPSIASPVPLGLLARAQAAHHLTTER
ncbi:MAG TPA: NAD(P)/FAD-dependent oxidoreductase [Micromonospora sp.]|nr:NAD(P)/FAD-dependent oxidoreductase [Micromonospora sp.]